MCMSKIHYELFSVDRQLSNSKTNVAERSAMEVHRGQISTLCSITSTLGATMCRYKMLVHAWYKGRMHIVDMAAIYCQLRERENPSSVRLLQDYSPYKLSCRGGLLL